LWVETSYFRVTFNPKAKPMKPRTAYQAELQTIKNVSDAVTAVLKDTPQGAPADLLYAPITPHMGRRAFDNLLRTLLAGGKLELRKGRLFAGPNA